MPARTRNLDILQGHGGSYYNSLANPDTVLKTFTDGEWRLCKDVVGNRTGANPFDLSIVKTYWPTLNGKLLNSSGARIREFTNYPIDYEPAPSDPRSTFPLFDEIDRSNLGWQLLAKTNISQPNFGLPSFLAELPGTIRLASDISSLAAKFRDIPRLIKESGANLLKNTANTHLAWRWGIRPLISDFWKMLNFMRDVEERERTLSLLLERKGSLRRRAGLGQGAEEVSNTTVFLHSTAAIIQANRVVNHTSSMWGSVKWKLVGDSGIPDTFEERRLLAQRLTAGITSRGALQALWEITPWSWLLDWFGGFGTILAATDNTIPMTWSEVCVMRKTRSDSVFTIIPGPWQDWVTLSGSPIEIHERKERYLCAPILPFIPSLQPLVSPKAWSILGSLAVLKVFQRGRKTV